MPVAGGLVLIICTGLLAFAVTRFIRRHAAGLGLIAEPNERSSHATPTPSGGGLGIVAGGTLGAVALVWSLPGWAFVVAVLSLAIALIGFLDDRRPVAPSLRLFSQFLLVGILVWVLGPIELSERIAPTLPIELITLALVVGAVYWVNLFNFMDGIDGLAASEALFLLGAGVWLALDGGAVFGSELMWLAAIAAATLGFLVLNWPPARIFMGDAGSTYLGFMIALGALATIATGDLSLWQWLILAAVFVTDTTVTIARRLLLGENPLTAHRRHAYQRLSRRFGGHLPVTATIMVLNLVGLLPLAWWAGRNPDSAGLAALAAYLPLALLALVGGAGAPEEGPA